MHRVERVRHPEAQGRVECPPREHLFDGVGVGGFNSFRVEDSKGWLKESVLRIFLKIGFEF